MRTENPKSLRWSTSHCLGSGLGLNGKSSSWRHFTVKPLVFSFLFILFQLRNALPWLPSFLSDRQRYGSRWNTKCDNREETGYAVATNKTRTHCWVLLTTWPLGYWIVFTLGMEEKIIRNTFLFSCVLNRQQAKLSAILNICLMTIAFWVEDPQVMGVKRIR